MSNKLPAQAMTGHAVEVDHADVAIPGMGHFGAIGFSNVKVAKVEVFVEVPAAMQHAS